MCLILKSQGLILRQIIQSRSCCATVHVKNSPTTIRASSEDRAVGRMTIPRARRGNVAGLRLRSRVGIVVCPTNQQEEKRSQHDRKAAQDKKRRYSLIEGQFFCSRRAFIWACRIAPNSVS